MAWGSRTESTYRPLREQAGESCVLSPPLFLYFHIHPKASYTSLIYTSLLFWAFLRALRRGGSSNRCMYELGAIH